MTTTTFYLCSADGARERDRNHFKLFHNCSNNSHFMGDDKNFSGQTTGCLTVASPVGLQYSRKPLKTVCSASV